ncbi:MAG: 6,7-dimethyl-8-ribityllumazine synthase [Bacteroidales bacterium]|jgi:6,7-dimethyl-8-ribityllumazine synthase|nr:6,7-dimethyl-8-ribityllumazine synthase [Bacteroidales bacterium]
MATQNLSQYESEGIPPAKGMKVAIVVSEWNSDITFALRDGAVQTLLQHGMQGKDIIVRYVPGSFELTYGAQVMAEHIHADAVICLGCVIRGETPHFDYICQAVATGITEVSVRYRLPVIFGVLTTLSKEQALERSGGRHGNKGVEAAVTAIKMAAFKHEFLNI